MKISELPLPAELKEALARRGYTDLYPPQEEAIRLGVLEGENLLLCSPTASGKTLVAQMLIFKKVLEEGGLALYLTPLRALASEKYQEFSSLGDELGVKVALSIGDYDSADPWLEKYDVIIATNEKADSLLRHRPSWLKKLKVLVIDEVHLLNESKRGPTLEMIIARFKCADNIPQLLALSATVRNSEEIASWLGAKVVSSDWRPVTLKEGVYYEGEVEFSDGSSITLPKMYSPITDLAITCVNEGGQALIFAPTRRTAVSMARRLALRMKRRKTTAFEGLSKELLALERNSLTEQLALLVSRGVAFHHAGLSHAVRSFIERKFRENLIKIVVATPTLAAGVNLPARRVIISDYKRYNVELGYYEKISTMEYKQMAGRAGRPKYDKYGEAILIARTLEERDFLWENYIMSPPERIVSRLSSEPQVRAHLLATVASGYASSKEEVKRVFENTLFTHQFGTFSLETSLKEALNFLEAHGMIKREGNKLRATELGRRVSSLYIDPKTASIILTGLEEAEKRKSALAYLHLIVSTPDMSKLYLTRKEKAKYDEIASELSHDLFVEPPTNPYDYEFFLAELKTAFLLYDWIEERSEDYIIEEYRVGPGDIYSLTQTAEWLSYAASEIALIRGLNDHFFALRTLRQRLKHGVKEELLELVSIKGIGRVRARALYNHGYKTLKDLLEADVHDLAKVPTIGPTLAEKIKAYLKGEEDKVSVQLPKRVTLEDYFK